MSKAAEARSSQSQAALLNKLLDHCWRDHLIYFGFAFLFVLFAIVLRNRGFLDERNLLNIVRQSAMIAVMSVAMTFVLAAGEIDLSIGSVAGLVSIIAATLIGRWGLWAGVGGGLGAGLLLGAAHGFLVTFVRIPSFLTTLATLGIARGIAIWISSTGSVPILNQTFNFVFGSGSIKGIPILLVWVLVALISGHIGFRKTSFGRKVMAVGGNEIAARYSGVDVGRIKFQVLVISAFTAALAGLLYAGRLNSGRYQLGEGDELSVIAAVVLGGTSLFGGTGTVVGSIVGALMIRMVNNALLLLGLDFAQQLIVRGLIILLAVAISRSR